MANIIERNIFVLRDASCVAQPIEYVQGTNAVPILLHVRDFEIPTGSTARVYVEWPSTKGEYDESGVTIDGNDILIEPKDTLFSEVGKSNLQVCIVNGAKTLVTFSYPVMVKRNHVPGITTPAQNHSDFLDEYISNMQSATDSANEASEKAAQSANEANEALEAFKSALEGTVINDETPSDVTTYSSEKIEMFDIQESDATTLHNTAPGGYRLTELVGATEKNGEPTPTIPIAIENYADCVEMMNGYLDSGTGEHKTSKQCICTKRPISCKSGDVIKVTLIDVPKHMYLMFYGDNDNYVTYDRSVANATSHEFTVPSNATKFRIRLDFVNDITPATIGKITLTVNGKYVGQIVSKLGAEMIQGTYGTSKGEYQTSTSACCIKNLIPCTSGDVVSILTENNLTTRLYMYDKNKNFIQSVVSSATNKYTITIPSSVEVSYIAFRLSYADNRNITPETVGRVTFTINGIGEKITTFFLNEPLRATDRIVRMDGVLMVERNGKEYVFDGGENVNITDTGSFYIASADNPIQDADFTNTNGYCDCLKVTSYDDIYNGVDNSIGLRSSGALGFRYNAMSDVNSFKSWLAEVKPTFQYPLATPIYETLDTASQIALNDMVTFDGVTYIEVDSKVKPTSISGEYGTSQVGAYTLKCMNDNDTDRVERAELRAQIENLTSALLVLTSESEGE